jgi:hypothetical protein
MGYSGVSRTIPAVVGATSAIEKHPGGQGAVGGKLCALECVAAHRATPNGIQPSSVAWAVGKDGATHEVTSRDAVAPEIGRALLSQSVLSALLRARTAPGFERC